MQRLKILMLSATAAALLSACSTSRPPSSGHMENTPSSSTSLLGQATEPGSTPKVEKPARGANRPYTVLGRSYTPITGDKPLRQRGIASWYGKQFHGKKTSNGEIFNMYAVSAAHKTIELPSYAKVTNLENGRSIILRINDRGPFYGERIIDLSYEAARRLGYASKGTAQVEVERITMASIADGSWKTSNPSSIPIMEPATSGIFTASAPAQGVEAERQSAWSVQIGAFSSLENARAWSAHSQAMMSMHGSSLGTSTRIVRSADQLYRVMLGTYHSRAVAHDAAQDISQVIGASAFASQR